MAQFLRACTFASLTFARVAFAFAPSSVALRSMIATPSMSRFIRKPMNLAAPWSRCAHTKIAMATHPIYTEKVKVDITAPPLGKFRFRKFRCCCSHFRNLLVGR